VALLRFGSFQNLIAEVSKENLFDAVKPQLQLYAEHKYPNIKKGEAYEKIFDLSFEACGATGKSAGTDIENNIVGRMGNGSGGRSGNYKTDRLHAERLFYFFLFSEENEDVVYGTRISHRLFKKDFHISYAKQLRQLGVPRPQTLPPINTASLGEISILLGEDNNLRAWPLYDDNTEFDLLDENGVPKVYEAIHWKSRLSGIYGRDNERQKLLNWALDDCRQAKVMLISGPGGSGKTRLASHIAEKLVYDHNWSGGFLPNRFDSNTVFFDGSGVGVIIVIDYPEERTNEVSAILQAAAEPQEYDKPIRIILASRENKDMWSNILNQPRLTRFDEISLAYNCYLSKEDALCISEDIAREYSLRLKRPINEIEGIEEWLGRDPINCLALNVVAASVHAVLSPEDAYLLDNKDILFAIANFEIKRAQSYSKRNIGDQNTLKKLLALSLLTDHGLNKYTIFLLSKSGICRKLSADELLDAVTSTPYWKSNSDTNIGQLMKLAPHKAAAAFFIKALSIEDPSPSLPEWINIVLSQNNSGFLHIAGRMIYDVAQIQNEAGLQLEENCVLAAEVASLPQDLYYEVMTFPYTTYTLNFVASIYVELISIAEDHELMIDAHFNFILILSALNRYEDAFVEIDHCHNICDELMSTNPNLSMFYSGRLFHYKSNILMSLGMQEEALSEVENSISLLERDLGEFNEYTTKHIAGAYLGKSSLHAMAGKWEEGLSAVTIAENKYRQVIDENEEIAYPGLISSLDNHANILSNLARNTEAIDLIKKTIDLCKRLSIDDPGRYRRELARTLGSYSRILFSEGKIKEAIEIGGEATAIYRELFNYYPDLFATSLAKSLANQAIALARGKNTEPIVLLEEAISISVRYQVEAHRRDNSELETYLQYYEKACKHLEVEMSSEILAIIQNRKKSQGTRDKDHSRSKYKMPVTVSYRGIVQNLSKLSNWKSRS
jgi:DNA polymerase III delta prime subunit